MAKDKKAKNLKRCDDCMEKKVANGVEYCSLRLDYPNWYSMQPLGKEHDCTWYKKKS